MALNITGTTGISGVDGSVSAPALTGTDSNTGITFPAADTIKFSTGGVERMQITNSGVTGTGVGGKFASYAIICDQKSQGTTGGTPPNTTAYNTRDLNTELADADGIVSISSNQFTLQAGTYYIKAQACAINVNNHTAKIRNITDSSDTLIGNSNKTQPSSNNVSAYALVQGSFTIAAAKTFELQHRCADTQTTHGFGAYNGFSANVYATVEIYKRN